MSARLHSIDSSQRGFNLSADDTPVRLSGARGAEDELQDRLCQDLDLHLSQDLLVSSQTLSNRAPFKALGALVLELQGEVFMLNSGFEPEA